MHLDETFITDYVDGTLDAERSGEVERHLAACTECRTLVDDFRDIRGVAGSLELREPPARAWGRIERAIALDREHSRPPAAGARSMVSAAWLAAAAALLVATIAGVRYAATTRPAPAEALHGAAADSAEPSAAAVEAELRAAESHYDKAIKGLEQIASAEQGALDPNTAATLQKNLAVIDQAISESRAAVVAQPTSEPARESLLESFRTKLALLQDTVALINEMRKGNQAGAARVVSGLKEKGD
jgi:anti-sigma factor RsiW